MRCSSTMGDRYCSREAKSLEVARVMGKGRAEAARASWPARRWSPRVAHNAHSPIQSGRDSSVNLEVATQDLPIHIGAGISKAMTTLHRVMKTKGTSAGKMYLDSLAHLEVDVSVSPHPEVQLVPYLKVRGCVDPKSTTDSSPWQSLRSWKICPEATGVAPSAPGGSGMLQQGPTRLTPENLGVNDESFCARIVQGVPTFPEMLTKV